MRIAEYQVRAQKSAAYAKVTASEGKVGIRKAKLANDKRLRSERRENSRFCLEWNVARDQFPQIQLSARVIDIDSDQVAFAIVIQNHAFRDLPALDARSVREINIKGICVWKIIQLHGRNLRSKNALCMVSLSESVTTRKKRPCNSSTLPQNR